MKQFWESSKLGISAHVLSLRSVLIVGTSVGCGARGEPFLVRLLLLCDRWRRTRGLRTATSSDGELWPRALHQSRLGAPRFWAALAPPGAANQETGRLAVCLGLGNKLIKISIYFFSLVPRGRRVFSCDVEMCPSRPGRPGSRHLCQSASEGPRVLPSTPGPVSNGGGPAASGRMRAPGGSCCSARSWARPSRGHGAGPRQSPGTSSFNKLPRRFMWQVTRILKLLSLTIFPAPYQSFEQTMADSYCL